MRLFINTCEEGLYMKCPKCGGELRRSTKEPEFGLCDSCKIKYRWKEDDDYELSKSAKPKISKCLLIAFILGVLYLIYSAFYWSGTAGSGADSAEQLGSSIATALVMPHLVMTVLAVIFNALGLFMRKRGFALTGAILYAVAMVLFPLYFMFVIIQMILSFVGFAKMKNR